jgi:predicted molibdopterin-dependent oxidoreductase YjgC
MGAHFQPYFFSGLEEERMSNRVTRHIVLGDDRAGKSVGILVDGRAIQAKEGEKILAALLAQGIIVNRYTVKRNEPRGLFCGIGQCTDCAMVVDGKPNVRTCMTPVREGMVIETQRGLGRRSDVTE